MFTNSHSVFEVSCRLAILCTASPAVFARELDVLGTHTDHGFNGNHHTFFQQGACTRNTIVGNIGAFVHLESNTMST